MMFKHKNSTNHGIDISKTRLDDIDRAVIDFALGYKGKKVAVDLGCGSGRVSIILALMGFDVYLYDIQDLADYFIRVGEALEISDKLHFAQVDLVEKSARAGEGDASTPLLGILPKDIVIAISQRTLHHLPHNNAKDLLQMVSNKMINDGKLFISISGIESKVAKGANGYRCSDSPVAQRFCQVGEVGKTTYSINGDVCLYKQEEVADMLEGVELTLDKVYKSAFGNIKAICTKSA